MEELQLRPHSYSPSALKRLHLPSSLRDLEGKCGLVPSAEALGWPPSPRWGSRNTDRELGWKSDWDWGLHALRSSIAFTKLPAKRQMGHP